MLPTPVEKVSTAPVQNSITHFGRSRASAAIAQLIATSRLGLARECSPRRNHEVLPSRHRTKRSDRDSIERGCDTGSDAWKGVNHRKRSVRIAEWKRALSIIPVCPRFRKSRTPSAEPATAQMPGPCCWTFLGDAARCRASSLTPCYSYCVPLTAARKAAISSICSSQGLHVLIKLTDHRCRHSCSNDLFRPLA